MEPNGESKFKKLLYNEVTLVIAIVGITIGVISYFASPSQKNSADVTEIKNNLSSYQNLSDKLNNIKDNDLHTLTTKVNEIDVKLNRISEDIIKLQTIIEERFPKR